MIRPRLTTRRLMVAVALIAVVLGGFEAVKVKQRAAEHRGKARGLANMVNLETNRERYLRDLANRLARQARQIAADAGGELSRVEPAADPRLAGIDPGILGRLFPQPSEISVRADYQKQINIALAQARQAQQLLAEANLIVRRVEHFAGLRAKYEQAALRPWRAVEPDVPEPK